MLLFYILALYFYNILKVNKYYKIPPNIGLLAAMFSGIIITMEETKNFKGLLPIQTFVL
jgi:hypothetical protein